jgi:hypothetical protein
VTDVVDTIVLETTNVYRKIRITNVSDSTGESAVIKVDKSALVDVHGLEPRRLIIMYVKWAIQGFASVRLNFDHSTDDEGLVLPVGSGERDYFSDGGLKDPLSAGGTGDLLLTTNGGASGSTYDIVLHVRLDAQK